MLALLLPLNTHSRCFWCASDSADPRDGGFVMFCSQSVRQHINRVPEAEKKALIPRLVGKRKVFPSTCFLLGHLLVNHSCALFPCQRRTCQLGYVSSLNGSGLQHYMPLYPLQRRFNSQWPQLQMGKLSCWPHARTFCLPQPFSSTSFLSSFQTLWARSNNNVHIFKKTILIVIFDYTKTALLRMLSTL